MTEPRPLDERILAAEALARRAVAGEAGVFRALMAALWDPCLALARASRVMRSSNEDDAREVVTELMAKLERDEHRALKLYVDWAGRHPDKGFADWIKITLANVVRDHARERRGGEVGQTPEGVSAKRLLNELAQTLPLEDLGVRPPVTDAQTARQLLEFARGRLAEGQLSALHDWLQGKSYDAIAGDLALESPQEAKRLVRAAVAVLRRQFGAPDGDDLEAP